MLAKPVIASTCPSVIHSGRCCPCSGLIRRRDNHGRQLDAERAAFAGASLVLGDKRAFVGRGPFASWPKAPRVRSVLGETAVGRGLRAPAAQIVLESEQAHRDLVSSNSLQLRVELPPQLPDIWGDRDRLFQVFENLLGNAAKFTPAGGQITVGARPSEREIVFWVADTGNGIAASDVPRSFERFWQARKGERRGAGLGLSIAKGIVEAHGGRIWVDTAPGRGSTFAFTVPVAPAMENRPREAP